MAKDGSSGTTPNGGADSDLETEDIDSPEGDDGKVSRKSYQKAVTEAKNARVKLRDALEKAQALEDEKLRAAGDKDGEIKTLRQQLDAAQKTNKGLQQTVIKKALNAQIAQAATKAGCIDPDAVMRLIDLSEIGDVDAETLEADKDAVESTIQELKKSKPYLFQKPGPKINNRNPSGKIPADDVEKEDISKLTPAEIRLRLRKLDQQKN